MASVKLLLIRPVKILPDNAV